MAYFPYTLAPGNLLKFFSHIQKAGIPGKVTQEYLQKSGFKSSNDRAIVTILKFIRFLDSSGVPTDLWKNYRAIDRAKGVLAAAIKKAYAELFSMYPDAHRKDIEALRNYFSPQTSVGDRALNAIMDTFKALCSISDFEVVAKPTVEEAPPEKPEPIKKERPEIARELTININLQLQLPATQDESIYDKFFAALKKHLMSD